MGLGAQRARMDEREQTEQGLGPIPSPRGDTASGEYAGEPETGVPREEKKLEPAPPLHISELHAVL